MFLLCNGTCGNDVSVAAGGWLGDHIHFGLVALSPCIKNSAVGTKLCLCDALEDAPYAA